MLKTDLVKKEYVISGILNMLISEFDAESGGMMFVNNKKLTLQKPAFNITNFNLIDAYTISLEEEANASRVFTENKPYLSNQAIGDQKIIQRFVKMYNVKNLMTVPLTEKNQKIGVIHIINKKHGNWNLEDLSKLEFMARCLCPALMALRIFDEQNNDLINNIEQYIIKMLFERESENKYHELAIWFENFGLDLTKSNYIVISDLSDKAEKVRIQREFKRSLQLNHIKSISGFIGQYFIAIIPSIDKLESFLSDSFTEGELAFGISQPCIKLKDYLKGFDQAINAYKIGKIVNKFITIYDKNSLHQVFSVISDNEQVKSYAQNILIPLIEYDNKHKANLIQTATEYLQNNTNQRRTADALYIHLNTLRYRLELIEELTKLNLKNFTNQYKIQVAIDIGRFLKLD
ncbi:MAG: PucR family transcriptional regulator [Bacillota bacterium]